MKQIFGKILQLMSRTSIIYDTITSQGYANKLTLIYHVVLWSCVPRPEVVTLVVSESLKQPKMM
jgi:hypothetical protein